MALDLEEQEQLSAIKSWWEQYGRLVIVTVVGSVLAVGGVRGWHYYKSSQSASAVALFAQQQAAERASDHKRVRDIGTEIVERYGSTAYGTLAALSAAKSDFDTGDLAAAKKRLQWVIDRSKEEEARDVARLRLARVLHDEKNTDEALKLLETKHLDSFAGLYADLKGDLLYSQGKREEARAAYQLALDRSDAGGPMRQIIQLKLDAVGGAK
ncbi:MAG: tetratricopeptide repeat protein [Burkholderiales bacterium]|jgi:predicted negative regulator of RcsB-dependent stress response|nr:tetratricopeptide repeat protein [Burkholderiales bacterium]MDP2397423.1 tetratricopeptide repeat protein [Burkholderiales bacterium]